MSLPSDQQAYFAGEQPTGYRTAKSGADSQSVTGSEAPYVPPYRVHPKNALDRYISSRQSNTSSTRGGYGDVDAASRSSHAPQSIAVDNDGEEDSAAAGYAMRVPSDSDYSPHEAAHDVNDYVEPESPKSEREAPAPKGIRASANRRSPNSDAADLDDDVCSFQPHEAPTPPASRPTQRPAYRDAHAGVADDGAADAGLREDHMVHDDDYDPDAVFDEMREYSRERSEMRRAERGASAEEEGAVFSRLYLDAQRKNRERRERQEALDMQRLMEKGILPYDKKKLRELGIEVSDDSDIEVEEQRASGSHSNRGSNTRREVDIDTGSIMEVESIEAGGQRRGGRRATVAPGSRKQSVVTDYSIFDRLSRPQQINQKLVDRLQAEEDQRKQALQERRNLRRGELEEVAVYQWDLPAPSLRLRDLVEHNENFAA